MTSTAPYGTSSAPSSGTLAEIRRACRAAAGHRRAEQHADGSWAADPDPRITETALVCHALARPADAGDRAAAHAVRRARVWLRDAAPQRHDPAVRLLEALLRSFALGEPEAARADLRAGHRTAPPARARLLRAVALTAPAPADPTGDGLAAATAAARLSAEADRVGKPWTRAEILAELALVQRAAGRTADASATLVPLLAEQRPDGSFHSLVLTTALAFLALDTVAPGTPPWDRARAFLLTAQRPDGTWRFCTTRIWDTALTVRSFRSVPAFDAGCLGPALDRLRAAQNPDGGWPCRPGLASDYDTTAAALIALADGAPTAPRTFPTAPAGDTVLRGLAFLRAGQNATGLWPTWQSAVDPPAQDVVAHVLTALRLHRGRHRIDHRPARSWLAAQWHTDRRWTADWYRGVPYATAEAASALPGHETARRAADRLVTLRNPDGGWSAEPGEPSTPGPTGLALTALGAAGHPAAHPADPAVRLLLTTQRPDGSWPGTPEMYGPRPLLTHYHPHTQAFAAGGLRAVLETADGPGGAR
ncbi:prenyltransferase/squalene oxidase repeat-containing protein [Streptomyces sp. NPDC000594]|uniref:prenyltransferase/squalene oxidase repeat-containing protein n=1 Tax=Streptomyces sp. NPDC000594 TaxID=3154261 RepID=UPI0033324B11